MFLLDRLLVGGLGFVLDKVAQATNAEADEEPVLREDLLAAQMRLELGEIDEQEFVDIEADTLARLRAIHERRRGIQGAVPTGSIAGVEVSFGDDDDR